MYADIQLCLDADLLRIGDFEEQSLAAIVLMLEVHDGAGDLNPAVGRTIENSNKMTDGGLGNGIVEKVHIHIHCRPSDQIRDAAHDHAAFDGQVLAKAGQVNGLENNVMRNLGISAVVVVAFGDKSVAKLFEAH